MRLKNVEIRIFGDNNSVVIQNNTKDIRIAMENNVNKITISEYVYIGKVSLLAALEGTQISIGCECMIAEQTEIRTSDSHFVTDIEGRRINPAKKISIGNHVWIGAGCMLIERLFNPRWLYY